MHYTYAYLRKNRTPYYIGKGQKDRAYKKGKKEVRPPKDKSRIIFLKKNLTEEEAFRHEKYMIKVLGRIDLGTGILRNKTDGGEGARNCVRSEKTRKIISEKAKERYKNNPNINPMFRADVREKWLSVIKSEEYINKQIESSYRRKEIIVDGVVYKSIRQASIKTGMEYGFLELKMKETSNILYEDYVNWINTKQNTKSIKIIIDDREFSSLNSAVKETGISVHYIKKCIEKNEEITSYGYEQYTEDYAPRKVEIDGKVYNSLKEASNATGRCTKYLRDRYINKIPYVGRIGIEINGTYYCSVREASKKTGIQREYLTQYIKHLRDGTTTVPKALQGVEISVMI
jgi:hypothetical protein